MFAGSKADKAAKADPLAEAHGRRTASLASLKLELPDPLLGGNGFPADSRGGDGRGGGGGGGGLLLRAPNINLRCGVIGYLFRSWLRFLVG